MPQVKGHRLGRRHQVALGVDQLGPQDMRPAFDAAQDKHAADCRPGRFQETHGVGLALRWSCKSTSSSPSCSPTASASRSRPAMPP